MIELDELVHAACSPGGSAHGTAVYSRRVVGGWSIEHRPSAALATPALGMAIQNRTPPPPTVIHSDRRHPVHVVGVDPTRQGAALGVRVYEVARAERQ